MTNERDIVTQDQLKMAIDSIKEVGDAKFDRLIVEVGHVAENFKRFADTQDKLIGQQQVQINNQQIQINNQQLQIDRQQSQIEKNEADIIELGGSMRLAKDYIKKHEAEQSDIRKQNRQLKIGAVLAVLSFGLTVLYNYLKAGPTP